MSRWDPRLVHGAPDGPLARPLAPTRDIVVDSSLRAMTGVTQSVQMFALRYLCRCRHVLAPPLAHVALPRDDDRGRLARRAGARGPPAAGCARSGTVRGAGRRQPLRRLLRMGRRSRARAVPRPGGGADRALHGRERRARHPDRLGQEPGGDRRPLRRARAGPAHVLHRADQGPRLREVLRARGRVRRRAGRHAHRRRERQPRRADHLLHRGGPRQPRPPRGRRRRRRPGRDGRVPLLRRTGPGMGVAGAASRADRGRSSCSCRRPSAT